MSVCRFELVPGEQGYPEQLAATPDPPKRLYGLGDPEMLTPGLAVIGARKATPTGIALTELFAGWAARAGYSIISGAAIGCDQAAHRAALKESGTTVAVLGCGADVDYPSGASELIDAIRSRGCVVSELPWGTRPTRWTFHRRNRIIAGLSGALLVIEARVPSGTFLTADFAADAGRDVLAVPGSILSPESRGPNRLIRQGARPVTELDDLARELEDLLGAPAGPTATFDHMPVSSDPVLSALAAEPGRPDDIAFRLRITVSEAVRRLTRLASSGLVERYADGRYGAKPASEPPSPRYNVPDERPEPTGVPEH